jgi:hypothetical protein
LEEGEIEEGASTVLRYDKVSLMFMLNVCGSSEIKELISYSFEVEV